MSDEKTTALSPDVLRSTPSGGGLIHLLSALICIASFVFGSARISYATSYFETQITAHDAAAGDQFGIAVSLSGETLVVGAPFDDDAGSGSGSAYVFQREAGGGDGWVEVKKLTASDARGGDWFGYEVAISGNTIVVGAPFDDDAGSASGSVYLFERDVGGGDGWGQLKKLTAADAAEGDRFGYTVSISGNTVVAGAPTDDDAGSESGGAYVFERDAGGSDNWGQVVKLTADDASAGDEFGFAVAVSGDELLVGAPFTGGNTGSAYVFERALGGAENWGQNRRLRASRADAGDQFGFSVAINQGTALVGARYVTGRMEIPGIPTPYDPNPDPIVIKLNNAGAAYFFERDFAGADTWSRVRKRVAANAQSGDQFGFSVAIHGDRAVIGSLFARENRSGAAYIVGRNRGGSHNWGSVERLTASDARYADEYGLAVSIGSNTIAVGAPTTDGVCPDDRDCNSGSTYVYTMKQSRDQQACINALNASLAKVSAAHAKMFYRCIKDYAKSGASAEACLMAPNSTLERAEQRTFRQESIRCVKSEPDYGATDAITVNAAAMQLEADVIREIFGVDLDAVLVTSDVDKDAAKCQQAVVKSVDKCQQSKLKEFNRCKKTGLRKTIIRKSGDFEDCWGHDPRGAVARACDPVNGKLATRVLSRSCVARGVGLSGAFPGCGTDDSADLAICVDEIVECRVCAALNRVDDLALDCDLLDDGVENSSCL
jgi:hypothetical protein